MHEHRQGDGGGDGGKTSARSRPVVVLMGVCGSGKTTVGRQLATRLACPFHDADDLHPPANIAKMAAGRPLTDADRAPWLAAVRATVDGLLATGAGGVVACSALKHAYRDALGIDRAGIRLVLLDGGRELLATRLAVRSGHYMPPDLLASQLATLERPEDALVIDVARPTEEVVREIATALGVDGGRSASRGSL